MKTLILTRILYLRHYQTTTIQIPHYLSTCHAHNHQFYPHFSYKNPTLCFTFHHNYNKNLHYTKFLLQKISHLQQQTKKTCLAVEEAVDVDLAASAAVAVEATEGLRRKQQEKEEMDASVDQAAPVTLAIAKNIIL
ncbi:uncharacterized protein LOC132627181 isoform X1 [Lycium barbarum]|uniref:uncharacterized protein LOC132627181 isoform X1 n=1 Tax=Lycium barbarum TaxID=112863 RepID=UPI00293E9ADD|nr:uncharacterized protein LOC132627181 isoform X1 [Lycium barbarum]